jgi:hypothetical protein
MKSKFVLFRLADDEVIYLADLEAGTVERREPDETAGMELTDAARDGDGPAVNGLDFAFASSVRSTGAAHMLFPSR